VPAAERVLEEAQAAAAPPLGRPRERQLEEPTSIDGISDFRTGRYIPTRQHRYGKGALHSPSAVLATGKLRS